MGVAARIWIRRMARNRVISTQTVAGDSDGNRIVLQQVKATQSLPLNLNASFHLPRLRHAVRARGARA